MTGITPSARALAAQVEPFIPSRALRTVPAPPICLCGTPAGLHKVARLRTDRRESAGWTISSGVERMRRFRSEHAAVPVVRTDVLPLLRIWRGCPLADCRVGVIPA